MTTAASWAAIKALFETCVDLPAAAREPLITAAALDAAGLAELRSLLAHHDDAIGQQVFMAESAAQQLAEGAARVGQRLGAWAIVRAIGAGGMGEVFEARRADGSYDGRAAVKLLKRGMDSAAVLQRFAQERQALARLNHPHSARLLDAGASEEGLPYFVLEFVDGQPIDEAVRPLALEQRLKLFLQLADAVAHAHRNLLVHRDLKPGNVLVDTEGRVKLLDFGIAKALDPLEGHDGHTTVGGVRPYTPNYASPEQVRGEPVSTATDIYSLGVLLYQMLTGTRPTGRNATTPAEAARSVLEDEPTRPSRLSASEVVDPQWLQTRKRLEGDLDNILLKALEKAPERRYASVDALTADITAFLQGHPVSARRAHLGYVAGKFLRRHRWAVLAAALGGLGLLTGLATALLQRRVALALAAVGVCAGLVMALAQARRAQLARDDAARARDDAQRHLSEMWRLANSMVFDVNDAMERGVTEGRRQLVHAAALSLQRQVEFGVLSDSERIDLASALSRLAKLEGLAYTDNTGDSAAAFEHYQQAVKLLEPMAPRHEANADWQGAMVSALGGLSSMQRGMGQREMGLATMHRVAIHAARAATLKPDDFRWRVFECAAQIELSSHNYHVSREHGLNRLDAALVHIADALAATQRLTDSFPNQPRSWALRAQALRNYGGLMEIKGRLADSVQAQRDSLAALERAMVLPGGELQRQVHYPATLQHLGVALERVGETDEPARLFAQTVTDSLAAHRADPTNQRLLLELLSCVCIAWALDLRRWELGHFDETRTHALACVQGQSLPRMDVLTQRHVLFIMAYSVVADAYRGRAADAAAGMARLRDALDSTGLKPSAAHPNEAELMAAVDTAQTWCEAINGQQIAACEAAQRAQNWLQCVYQGRAAEDMSEHLLAVDLLVRLARAPFDDSVAAVARRASIVEQARRFDAVLIERGVVRPDQRIESRWLALQN